ncbi:MAG: putative N-acetylmuramoyl-L-alanine amidase [Acidobacteria bacterium]|nr:putative N-acetylmuramoyl-L-alanine amidase [Acidobacteriota bacterium]
MTTRSARPLAAALAALLVLAAVPGAGAGPQVPPGPPTPPPAAPPAVPTPLEAAPVPAAPAPSAPSAFRVVIDPGHGATEDGAIGPSGLKEKDLALDMARRLAALLKADGFEVVLTREGDDGPTLDQRAEIANVQRADVFISLHANASRSSKARGAETYFLSRDATDDAARTVAAIENDAAGVNGDRTAGAAGGEGDAAIPLILWDMAQTIYLEQSSRLAEIVQRELNGALGITDRGVRQAPFRVLVGATMPAVLVELGFLTNPEEEKRLADGEYRRKLSEALAAALRQYRAKVGVRGAAAGAPR